jgi:hypothetical protein
MTTTLLQQALVHLENACMPAPSFLAEIRAVLAAQPQPEPVAWAMPRPDGLVLDVITPEEHARHEGEYTVALCKCAAQPSDMAPEPYLCIKPACGNDCSGCNNAISPQTMREYAIAHAATLAAQPAPVPAEQIDDIIRDVAELDYNSPEGMPDVMLVTADELRVILQNRMAQPAPVPAKCDGGTCGAGGYCDNCPKQAAAPVPVPPGWKLVPVEPTERMGNCGFRAGAASSFAADMIYRAMIAASPVPVPVPVPPTEGAVDPDCNYMAPMNRVCSKCGHIHRGIAASPEVPNA